MRHLLLLIALALTFACNQGTPPVPMAPAPAPTPGMTMVPTATVTPMATPAATTTTLSTSTSTSTSTEILSSPTVMIFAAASTTDAITELATAFSSESGIAIKTNFAGSSTLAQQINAGAGADIFLSANEKWMDAVAAQAPPAARTDLLGNRLVAIVPADSLLTIKTPAELSQAGVTRLALGDPGAVPAGLYAKAALEKLGLWEGLKGRVVSANDVREAMMYVERGEAEAGIVYATDAALTPRVKVVFEFDPKLNDPIAYPVARLTESDEAKQVYGFLTSPRARDVFIKYGFLSLTPPAPDPTPAP